MAAGAEAHIILFGVFGTTEVVPFHKARFGAFDRISGRRYSMGQAPPPQQPPRPQVGPGSAEDAELPPLEMAPAPPLMSRSTGPPHLGQVVRGASDIFWR